jgi:DNA polymerase-3 subunit gamma/tau
MEVEVEEEDLPNEPFTEEDMQAAWKAYIGIAEKEGRHNFASILRIDKPRLIKNAIHVEYPNETNKVEVSRQQYELMKYVRKTLNNYSVTLEISVNETKEKQYAFTAMDKFNKLKEKNPNIELLRRTFDLDI